MLYAPPSDQLGTTFLRHYNRGVAFNLALGLWGPHVFHRATPSWKRENYPRASLYIYLVPAKKEATGGHFGKWGFLGLSLAIEGTIHSKASSAAITHRSP